MTALELGQVRAAEARLLGELLLRGLEPLPLGADYLAQCNTVLGGRALVRHRRKGLAARSLGLHEVSDISKGARYDVRSW